MPPDAERLQAFSNRLVGQCHLGSWAGEDFVLVVSLNLPLLPSASLPVACWVDRSSANQDALVASLKGNYYVTQLALQNNRPPIADELLDSIQVSLCRNQAVAEVLDALLEGVYTWPAESRVALSKTMRGSPFLYNEQRHGARAMVADSGCMPLHGTVSGLPFSFGVAEMTGRRVQMQDVVIMHCHFDGRADEHLFGIFDGHGGTHCSRFVGANFASILQSCIRRNGRDDPMTNLRETFDELDEQCRRYDIPNGSCAVVCYFVGDKVYCAGLGDSRAVLCREGSGRSGKAELMADVLKPTDESERRRIQKLGGLVTENGRVAGVLGVSRVSLRRCMHVEMPASDHVCN